MNKLCVCGIAMGSAVLWAGGFLFVGVINRFHPGYGNGYLQMVDSIYPGYHAGYGLKNLGVGAVYALVDGAICGALFAWVYNLAVSRCCCGKKDEDKKCC